MKNQVIAQAKKNFRDYRIIARYNAGLVLTGNEIKALRSQQVAIGEAYILPQRQELFALNIHIATYKYSHIRDLAKTRDTRRKRKLLLTKKEIKQLIGSLKAKNYVLIPLQLFINDKGWAKLEIALAQHLRKYQIKAVNKEKEIKRKLRQGDYY